MCGRPLQDWYRKSSPVITLSPTMGPVMLDLALLSSWVGSFRAKNGHWCVPIEARLFLVQLLFQLFNYFWVVECGPLLIKVKFEKFLVFGGVPWAS